MASGGSGGTAGTGGGTPDECLPNKASGPVADGCGIFVASTGVDGNIGSKDKPLKTLEAAIAKASEGEKRVYACNETFTEALTVGKDVTIFGGLDCLKGWAYAGVTKRTTWTTDADKVPVHVASGVSITMEDVNITAVDATATGGSSIAIIAEMTSTVDLTRSEVTAGLGADGLSGSGFPGPAADGAKGAAGIDACTAGQSVTPAPPVNQCDGVMTSSGGAGGTGLVASAGPGDLGSPLVNTNGGAAEGASLCTAGTSGAAGTDGDAGIGASGLGTIDATGYLGPAGSDGKPGAPGQGGGGGGGSKGGSGSGKCPDATKAAGASGGTGGSGGCGGLGGGGGTAGGSSIGFLSLSAKLLLANVTISTKNGGLGGAGATGQGGGNGGSAGNGGSKPGTATSLHFGCAGGVGGTGGNGGHGGGGHGGHSIGIAFLGEAPDIQGAKIFVALSGKGGDGDGVNDFTKGADGIAKELQPF